MITIKKLENLGFKKKVKSGNDVYYKGDYGLKYEMNNWQIIGNHLGIDLSSLNVIETIAELKKHYKETTGKELK